MSTVAIIVIIVVALALLAVIAIAMPRMRGRRQERMLERRRGEIADAHREQASARVARADEAERIAEHERAQAEAHEARARLHERGLADDELDRDNERLGESRFSREEEGATIPPDERPTAR